MAYDSFGIEIRLHSEHYVNGRGGYGSIRWVWKVVDTGLASEDGVNFNSTEEVLASGTTDTMVAATRDSTAAYRRLVNKKCQFVQKPFKTQKVRK